MTDGIRPKYEFFVNMNLSYQILLHRLNKLKVKIAVENKEVINDFSLDHRCHLLST